MKIQREIGDSYTLVAPHRVFIRRGQLTKKCRARDKAYEFLLFNDLLLYGYTSASGYLVINRELPIDSEFSVDDKADLDGQYRFEIVNSVKSFIVYTDDINVKFAWLLDLMHLTTELKQKSEKKTLMIRAPTRLNEVDAAAVSTVAKPVWQADNEATNCPLCRQGFSFLNRRHHCRKCGVLCCGDCSSARLPLIGSGSNERVRFCDRCAEESRRPAPPPPPPPSAPSAPATSATLQSTSAAANTQRPAPSEFSAKLASTLMGGRGSLVAVDASARPWQPQRLRAPSGAAPPMPVNVGGAAMATTVAPKPMALPGMRARGPSLTMQNASSANAAVTAIANVSAVANVTKTTVANEPHDVLVVSDSDSDDDSGDSGNGGGVVTSHNSTGAAIEDSSVSVVSLTSADLVSVDSLALFATKLRAAALGADAPATSASDAASTLFCRAKFDFAGRSLTELSVRAQSALFVLRRDADIDAQWWECADTDGHRGLVPVSYLDAGVDAALALAVMSERVGARVAAATAAATAAAAAKSLSAASDAGAGNGAIATDVNASLAELEKSAAASAAAAAAARLEAELPFEVMAKVDHSPATDSELGYVLADTLVVHSIDASGWWFGTNLRTQAVGWLAPDNVVRSIARRHTRGRSVVLSTAMAAAVVAGPHSGASNAASVTNAAASQTVSASKSNPAPARSAPVAVAANGERSAPVAQLGTLHSVIESMDEDSIDLVGRSRSNVVAEARAANLSTEAVPVSASSSISAHPAGKSANGSSAVGNAGSHRASMPPAGAVAQQLRAFSGVSVSTIAASSSSGTLKASSTATASTSVLHGQSAAASVLVASIVKMDSPVAAAASSKAAAADVAPAAPPMAAPSPSSGGKGCSVDACACTEFVAHPFKPNLCRDCRHAQASHS
jgi:hypothetical protein